MAKRTTDELTISRERMAELLNDDLAREYQAVIAYTIYSQVLKGAEYTDIAQELVKYFAPWEQKRYLRSLCISRMARSFIRRGSTFPNRKPKGDARF